MKLDCIIVGVRSDERRNELKSVSRQKFWDASRQTDVGSEEIDLRIKNLLSWQNILNERQIAADREEKLASQGEVLCGGINRIYFPYQSDGNHRGYCKKK